MGIQDWGLELRHMTPEELNPGYRWHVGMGRPVETWEEANLLTSRLPNGLNYILLDLDGIEAEVVPSSTAGNCHLYIKKALTEVQMDALIRVLRDIGLIQQGILTGWAQRRALCLRKPGVRKGVEQP